MKLVHFYRIILFCLFYQADLVSAQEQSSLMSYGGGRTGAGTCLFRDYQAIGINPANLGIFFGDEVQVTTGVLDASGLFYSDALPKSNIISSLINGQNLTEDEKTFIARDFLETGNSFTGEVMPIGVVVQFPGFGGLGFSWRERMSGSVKFSEPLADLVFNGINSKYVDTIIYDILGHAVGILPDSVNTGHLFNGSSLKYNWLREFNLSFGTRVINKNQVDLFVGGSIKFLQSNAIADIAFDADTISGFAAFSKLFNIDYANFSDPGTEFKGRLSPVGKGLGFDLGTTISFNNKYFAAVALTDIGSVRYKGNLVTITDAFKDSLFNFIGIDEANIFSSMDDIFNAEGLFDYLPSGEKTVVLPAQFRVGAGWRATKKFDFALDLIQPLNKVPGNLPKTQYAALVNFVPVNPVKISAGITGGGFADFDIPFGIAFSFTPHQIWQLSIGTGDIISLIKQDKPSISLNLSILRFHYD